MCSRSKAAVPRHLERREPYPSAMEGRGARAAAVEAVACQGTAVHVNDGGNDGHQES